MFESVRVSDGKCSLPKFFNFTNGNPTIPLEDWTSHERTSISYFSPICATLSRYFVVDESMRKTRVTSLPIAEISRRRYGRVESSLTKCETQYNSTKCTGQGRYITLAIRLNDISNYFISTPDTLHWPSSLVTVSIDIQHRATAEIVFGVPPWQTNDARHRCAFYSRLELANKQPKPRWYVIVAISH